jgi:hypothetical protein
MSAEVDCGVFVKTHSIAAPASSGIVRVPLVEVPVAMVVPSEVRVHVYALV